MAKKNTPTQAQQDELQKIMTAPFDVFQRWVAKHAQNEKQMLDVIKEFLTYNMVMTAKFLELNKSKKTAELFAHVEAVAKQHGTDIIKNRVTEHTSAEHYSVAQLKEDDFETAIKYMAGELLGTVEKTMYEYPEALRSPEISLRAIEYMFVNLLAQQWENANETLEASNKRVATMLVEAQSKLH